jgi:hypothetical protein
MRIVMTSLAVLALVACSQPSDKAAETNEADANMAMDANAMADANLATDAEFQINQTSWEFTDKGKQVTESIDENGNYVSWSGDEHIDHGKVVMKDGKACFTSAMDKEGEVCWTSAHTAIGETMETTSDKGEKLAVKRVEYVVSPPTP